MTRNGDGSGCVSPPIVTWRSCMTSSSADCTLAGARLISSASRKLPNTGPSSVSKRPVSGPVDARADEVGRDEVGRELDAAEACRRARTASVLTVSVLARPGTPSSSTWPPASSATSSRSSIASWPTITRLISYRPPRGPRAGPRRRSCRSSSIRSPGISRGAAGRAALAAAAAALAVALGAVLAVGAAAAARPGRAPAPARRRRAAGSPPPPAAASAAGTPIAERAAGERQRERAASLLVGTWGPPRWWWALRRRGWPPPSVRSAIRRRVEPALHRARPASAAMRVLIAEDEPRIAGAVARGLRREGMAVDVAPRRRARRSTRRASCPTTSSCSTATCPSVHGDDVCRALARRAAGHEGADAHRGAHHRRPRRRPVARRRRLPAQAVPLRRAGRAPARARAPRRRGAAAGARGRATSCSTPRAAPPTRAGRPLDLTPKEFAVLEVLLAAQGARRHARGARRARVGRAARPALQHGAHDGDDAAPQARRPAADRDGPRQRLPRVTPALRVRLTALYGGAVRRLRRAS